METRLIRCLCLLLALFSLVSCKKDKEDPSLYKSSDGNYSTTLKLLNAKQSDIYQFSSSPEEENRDIRNLNVFCDAVSGDKGHDAPEAPGQEAVARLFPHFPQQAVFAPADFYRNCCRIA